MYGQPPSPISPSPSGPSTTSADGRRQVEADQAKVDGLEPQALRNSRLEVVRLIDVMLERAQLSRDKCANGFLELY